MTFYVDLAVKSSQPSRREVIVSEFFASSKFASKPREAPRGICFSLHEYRVKSLSLPDAMRCFLVTAVRFAHLPH